MMYIAWPAKGFNEAAALKPRKATIRRRPRVAIILGFNEAAALKPRKRA